MNGKKARAIRKALKQNNELDLRNPDYRIAKEKKKLVYVETKGEDGLVKTEAKTVSMISIVNLKKMKYRNLKGVFKQMPRDTRNLIKER